MTDRPASVQALFEDLEHAERRITELLEANNREVERRREAERKAEELQSTFDLRWKADMRAIKRWQEKTGKINTWPDHADMVVFLLDRIDEMEASYADAGEGWLTTPAENTDDAPYPNVLSAVRYCAALWQGDARLLGNVRAKDIVRSINEVEEVIRGRAAAESRLRTLEALINEPHTDDFLIDVEREAAHQVDRWGTEHDRAKAAHNWFWLIGYLAGKALTAAITGDPEKAKHHTISTAAALLNWHKHLCGLDNRMQPGSADVEAAADSHADLVGDY